MGKQSTSDIEARLQALIREANGASGDLAREIKNAEKTISEILQPRAQEMVDTINKDMTEFLQVEATRRLDQLEREVAQIIKTTGDNVFLVFDTLLKTILTAEITNRIMGLLDRSSAHPDRIADLAMGDQIMEWAKGKQIQSAKQWETWRHHIGQVDRFGMREPLETRPSDKPGFAVRNGKKAEEEG